MNYDIILVDGPRMVRLSLHNNLIDCSDFAVNFSTRTFFCVGLVEPVNGFDNNVVIHITTPTQYINVFSEFITLFFFFLITKYYKFLKNDFKKKKGCIWLV